MRLTELRQSKILGVEGHGPKRFFEHYPKRLGITDIQVENFGGNTELRPFVKAAVLLPGFRERVVSVGVIRDAETDAQAAFQSVCGALEAARLPVPPAPITPAGDQPRVQAFILPGDGQAGMIETLCLQSVEADPAMPCVEEFFRCVENSGHAMPSNPTKARTHAFLATRAMPDLPMWTAAMHDYWDWSHPVFAPLETFLIAL